MRGWPKNAKPTKNVVPLTNKYELRNKETNSPGATIAASRRRGTCFRNGEVGDDALSLTQLEGCKYLANLSQPSAISPMICIIGRNCFHIASSIGTFVLSCFT